MDLNQTIGTQTNNWWNYASALPQWTTNKIVELLNNNNIHVTERWVSILLFAVSLLIIWLVIKVLNKLSPIIKWIIIIIILVLVIGLLLPVW